jgi:hypothetical protein
MACLCRSTPILNSNLILSRNSPPLALDVFAYAQAIHMGESETEAPALQKAATRDLCTLPNRLPLTRRPRVPVGVKVPA